MSQQIIKLKRSLTPGSRPSVGTLQLGELATNVADGNWFFERSGSIEQLITSTPVTASLNVSGSHVFKGPFLIKRNNGEMALHVKSEGYVVFGNYEGPLSSLSSPETGSLIYSGSDLFIYS